MNKTKKPNKALWAACVLLCLVLISTHFASGLYAKYVTGTADGDKARVSSFHPTAVMTAGTENGSYNISLHNSSETAVRYSVTVMPQNPGQIASCKLGEKTITEPNDDGAFIFTNVGSLIPGKDASAQLTIQLDSSYSDPDVVPQVLDFSNESLTVSTSGCPITVTVSYEQIG